MRFHHGSLQRFITLGQLHATNPPRSIVRSPIPVEIESRPKIGTDLRIRAEAAEFTASGRIDLSRVGGLLPPSEQEYSD
jgi:hypothetical protein